MEDIRDLLLTASADCSPDSFFKPIRTLPFVALLLALDVTLLISSFILPQYYSPTSADHPSLYSLLLYLQISLWVAAVATDQVLQRFHQKSQLRGYLEFNRKIMPLVRSFLITVTGCSIILLTLAAVAWDYCPREESTPCSVSAPLHPAHYVQIIISLQTSILLPLTLAYTVRIHQFNSRRSMPDIFEGQMVYSLSRSLPVFEEVGVRETTEDDTLLEKQAEAIHFLKEHNARLSRKILSLTDQLGRYSDATV